MLSIVRPTSPSRVDLIGETAETHQEKEVRGGQKEVEKGTGASHLYSTVRLWDVLVEVWMICRRADPPPLLPLDLLLPP